HRFRARAWRTHKGDFAAPRWRGEPLAGRRLLIHAEQGLGDAIQFSRDLSRFASDAHVILRVPAALVRLLARSFPAAHVIAATQPLRASDRECPLLSLPHVRGHEAPPAPYLSADPAEVTRWHNWLARLPGRHIGLVWAGNPRLTADTRRSIPLSVFAPLGDH